MLVVAVAGRALLYSAVASLAAPYGSPINLVFIFGPFLPLCMVRTDNLIVGLALLRTLHTEQNSGC